MKRYITILSAAVALMMAACTTIDLSGGMSDASKAGEEAAAAAAQVENGVSHLTLSRVLQKDPNNTGGLEIQNEFPEYFKDFSFDIYRTNGEITAVSIKENIPFEIYSAGTPDGKVDAYFNNTEMPWTIRQKSNDQVLAIYSVGKFYYPFRLGCQEVSYELYFKNAE